MASDHDIVDRLRIEIEALLREHPALQDDEIARLDTLDGATDVREVLIRLGRSLDDAKALAEGVADRIEELAARETRFTSRAELIRQLIFKTLEAADIKKIELPEVTLSLRANPQRLVGDADPSTLPDDLCSITRKVDRKRVRETLEAGLEVEGFTMSNAEPSLVVRVK